jgi:hypothetical protein
MGLDPDGLRLLLRIFSGHISGLGNEANKSSATIILIRIERRYPVTSIAERPILVSVI